LRGVSRNVLVNLATVALETFEREQCVFHEGRRQVVLGHVRHWLEDLEMVPPRRRPEHHMGLDRRATRDAAGELRHHQGFVFGGGEERLRPAAHTDNGRRLIGAFRGKAKHGNLEKRTCEAGSSRPATGEGPKSWRRYWPQCGSDPAGPSCANFPCRTSRMTPR